MPEIWRDRGGLLHDLGDFAVLVLALRAVLAHGAQQSCIRNGVEDRVVAAGVYMTTPEEVWHRHDVILFPVETLTADLREAFAFHHHDEGRASLAFEFQLFARSKQLRRVIQSRENRS